VSRPPVAKLASRFRQYAEITKPIKVLENPGRAFATELLGLPGVYRFVSGLSFPCNKESLRLSRELIRLAYEGAWIVDSRTSDPTAWRMDLGSGVLTTPSGVRFDANTIDAVVLSETFLYDIHFQGFDHSSRTVLDVGANIGDTALYYANKGARVLAFEPDPSNFAALTRNIALNPSLASRIRIFREAVGIDGTVVFKAGLRGGSGIYARGGDPIPVHSVSLKTILEREGIVAPFLLKSDSKGAEFQFVCQPEIGEFERLAIEYSADLLHKDVADLLTPLRAAGFSNLRVFKHNGLPYYLREAGTVFASRGEPQQDSRGLDC